MNAPGVVIEPAPLGHSILWKPVSGAAPPRTGPASQPIFIFQSVLAAIREHVAAGPMLGFLLGDLCESSDTGMRYIRVTDTIRLDEPLAGDRTTVAVKSVWDQVRAEVRSANTRCVGWYHAHAELGMEMSSYDVETHERYFSDPWQLALIVGTVAGHPAGGVFRAGGPAALVPFYEVLKEDSYRGEGGKQRSHVTWKNYRAYKPSAAAPGTVTQPMAVPRQSAPHANPTAAPVRPAPPPPPPSPPPPPPPPVLETTRAEASPPLPLTYPPPLPEGIFDDVESGGVGQDPFEPVATPVEAEPEAPPPPPKPRRPSKVVAFMRRSRGPLLRGSALVVVVAALGIAGWQYGPDLVQRIKVPKFHLPKFHFGSTKKAAAPAAHPVPAPQPPITAPAPPSPTPPPPPTPRVATPVRPYPRLDLAGDSLALAAQRFEARARLFARKQLDCPELARGIVVLEGRLSIYQRERQTIAGPLDDGRAAREDSLRAAADSDMRRFQSSGCPRP